MPTLIIDDLDVTQCDADVTPFRRCAQKYKKTPPPDWSTDTVGIR